MAVVVSGAMGKIVSSLIFAPSLHTQDLFMRSLPQLSRPLSALLSVRMAFFVFGISAILFRVSRSAAVSASPHSTREGRPVSGLPPIPIKSFVVSKMVQLESMTFATSPCPLPWSPQLIRLLWTICTRSVTSTPRESIVSSPVLAAEDSLVQLVMALLSLYQALTHHLCRRNGLSLSPPCSSP
jgi:hypothetical protein